MASYEAIINLVVQGEAALNRIQKKIDNLYKTVGDLETQKKFKGSQAAADFVREQADELERVVSVSKKQIKEQERSIVKQSKLNAAVDLYERRQRQLSRTSVANQKQFADQIKDIEEGFKFFKDRKSATGVQAIATELGRIIEYDNEINRISERRTANQRKLFSFTKEVAKYEAFGLRADRARESLSKFEKVAGSNQLRQAQQYEAALRNQLKLLKDQLVEQQRVAKIAPSSPVRGGVNFPGSPIAEEIALREARKGFPTSPVRGAATMAGSPIAKKEQAKAEKAIAEATEILGGAAQRLIGVENKAELKLAIDEYLSGLSSVQSSAEKILKKDAKLLTDFDKRLNERVQSREKAVADAWKMRGGPALPTGFTEAGVVRQKGTSVDIGAQRRLQSVLASGAIIEQGLINLRSKGANVSAELVNLQNSLNNAKQKDYIISENTLDVLASQVSLAGKFAQLQRTIFAGQGGGGRGSQISPESTGLENALMRLQEARGARQTFLGDVSPAEAIDKIVREFNTGKPGKGVGEVADNITESYASRIKAGIPAAAAAMRDLGVAGITAIKKALRMQSPSRVMLEIAKNQIDTYVDFLRAALPQVEAAAKAIGEAGTPKPAGVPESAIKKPITERARTRPLTSESLAINSAIAEHAASLITGPLGRVEEVKRKIEDFIDKTRTSVDLDKLFGGQQDERFAMATRGTSAGPEFDKTRAALADFYQIPAELTPGLERGAKAASNASADGDQLKLYVADLASGLEQIGQLLQSAAKLPTPTAVVDTEFTRAQQEAAGIDAAAAEAARKKAEAQQPFEASIQRAAELDAEAKRKADAAASSVVQAQIEADARAGAEAISKSILDPIESTAPEGERQVRSAIGNLFDRVAGALGFGGGGGGGRPPVPPTDGGGPTRDPGDFNRRLSSAAEQGAEALLGLQELREPAKATTVELEALSAVLKEFRNVLDPTVAGFDKLDKQLRETAAGLDRQLERRAPDADFLTRRFGPRGGRAVSEGLIGGAFPLLFGQGVGAAAGGGIGGALGGFAGGGLGFGLSLVGTALGTAFDTLNQAAQDTGKALNYPIEGFEKLKEAGLFATRQQEYYISKLIESGRLAEAAGEIQAEIIKKIGAEGVKDLRNLGDSSTKLSKAWAEFNLQLQAALSGPMTGLLKWLTNVIEIGNTAGREAARQTDILAGLSSGDKEKLLSEQSKLLGKANVFNEPQINKQISELYTRFAPLSKQPNMGGQLTPEQQEQALNKSIETAEKIRSLRQEGTALERNAQDLRLGIEDTVYGLRKRAADMERESIEFRRSVEDQVFGKRQELEQKLIENDRKRQQNAIDAFDLQLQRVSSGLNPIAQGIVDAARQYLRVRAEGEADLQQNERQLKLQLQQIDQEVARYRLQVEDRISQMSIQRDEFTRDVAKTKLQFERQIGDYVIQVEEYRLKMAKHRYDLEIDLEKKKQIAAQGGLTSVQASGGYTGAAVDGFPITSRPGMRWGRMHSGVDIGTPTGTALGYEIGGKVLSTGVLGAYGKVLEVQLDNGVKAFAAHLNEVLVAAGQRFEANQVLAKTGSTGRSTGPHVHMEGAKGGDPYAALPYLQLGKATQGQSDIYHQPGVGWFSRKSGRMVPGPGGGAGGAPQTSLPSDMPVPPAAPAMPELPSAPQLVQVNDLLTQYLDLQAKIKKALQDNNVEDARRIQLQAESARLAFEQQALSPIRQFQEQNRELQLENEKRQLRNRLLIEGVKPEIVEGELRVLEINKALNSVLEGLEITTNEQVKAELERLKLNPDLVDGTFSLTEATFANLVATTEDTKKQEELRTKLQQILDLRNKIAKKATGEAGDAVSGARDIAAQLAKPKQKIKDFIAQATTELDDFQAVAVRISQGIGDAVGNSIANGITGLIEGTTSAKEVFATFLKDVGQLLMQEATKMIATYIALGIAKMFAFGSTGGVSGGAGGAGSSDLPTAITSISPIAAKGAYFSGGVAEFASGGMFTNSVVSSPTLFQFADGGVPRMGLMGEAGPEAIMPLRRGPDGRLGVEASVFEAPRRAMQASEDFASRSTSSAQSMTADEASGANAVSAGGSITIQTQVINNVEYATVEQVREASDASVRKARSQVFADLKNRPASRQSAGIR